MTPTFFAAPDEFYAWLAAHHDTERELLVGFHKVGSGRPSITWPQSVDQALCFGWIDGVRRRIDDDSYSIRFTPRKARSTWSAVNIKRMGELQEMGLVHAAGAAAFQARAEARSGIYSYEQRDAVQLAPDYERRFRAHEKAWAYFQERPAWYRRTALWRVMSAKKEETREKRLAVLIEHSAAERLIPELSWNARPG